MAAHEEALEEMRLPGQVENMSELQSLLSLPQLPRRSNELPGLAKLATGDADGISELVEGVIRSHSQALELPPAPPVVASTASLDRSSATKSRAVDVQRLRGELERIKVDTMHDMVDKVSFTINEQQVKSSFLYLTNRQASAISVTKMATVREKLGIKDPKMVIRLMPSRFGAQYWKSFPFWNDQHNQGRFPCKQVPEVSSEDQTRTEHHLILLAKEVLLPLAIEAHALVMGNESCALVNAFAKVSAPMQRHLGDQCPFRLLIFARAYFFHLEGEAPGTVVSEFRKTNDRWSSPETARTMHQALKTRFGDDRAFWPREDLLAGEYSMVMFECLGSSGQLAQETSRNFQNDFIQSLSMFLPVIALQTYGTEKMSYVPAMADHVNRGLPLFLLDSRPRLPLPEVHGPQDYEKALGEVVRTLTTLVTELHGKESGGVGDMYNTSLVAFVKNEVNRALRSDSDECDDQNDGQKSQWLWEAIRDSKNRGKVRHKAGTVHSPSGVSSDHGKAGFGHDPAESFLVSATDIVMTYVGEDIEWESVYMMDRCEAAIKDVMEAQSWDDFSDRLDSNWTKIRGRTFHRYVRAEEFAKKHAPWCSLRDFGRDTFKGRQQLVIHKDCQNKPDLAVAKEELRNLLMLEFEDSRSYDELRNTKRAWKAQELLWLSVYDLLKSNNVHVGNLHDLRRVKKDLFALAQIERLPLRNSPEALILLRRAWVLVDLFHKNAAFYKICTKVSYVLSLLLSVSVVVVSVLTPLYPEAFDTTASQNSLLGLALAASLFTGTTTIVDPSTKWLQLRGSALTLESEIWKFRTRVADYTGSTSLGSTIGRQQAERSAEEAFHEALLSVQERVQQSSGLKDTSFYANTTATNDAGTALSEPASGLAALRKRLFGFSAPRYLHGQYPFGKQLGKKTPEVDNFHSPAPAQDYIKFRLVPQMAFYQSRIPRYACRRRFFQALLLISSILNALLSAVSEPSWTAIVASVASALVAWQEFNNMAKKLERYSTASSTLGNILMWWQSLPEVDQSNMRKVEQLVERTEGLLGGERAAWLSDAQQAVKLAAKQAAAGEQGPAKSGKESPAPATPKSP